MTAIFAIAGRLLLCLAVLISGSQAGFRHAHAGGDAPHTHGSDGDPHVSSHCHNHDNHCHEGSGHGHRHPHQHPGEMEMPAADATIEPVTAHVHVWLLGFQFTLPVPRGSETEDEGSQPILISLASGEFVQAPCLSPKNDCAGNLCLTPSLLRNEGFLPPELSCRSAESRPSSPPLCDTARHERSGVQLI